MTASQMRRAQARSGRMAAACTRAAAVKRERSIARATTTAVK
jgi:hypothetical protein